MAISFSVDNDRVLTGVQQLTLDETAGSQTTLDTNGAPSDVDDDVAASYDSGTNTLTSGALDPAFITFISNLFPADPAEDNALTSTPSRPPPAPTLSSRSRRTRAKLSRTCSSRSIRRPPRA